MATCEWCGKYISDEILPVYYRGGLTSIKDGPFCGQKCLKEWEAQTYGARSDWTLPRWVTPENY
jgi:hypothetical protein